MSAAKGLLGEIPLRCPSSQSAGEAAAPVWETKQNSFSTQEQASRDRAEERLERMHSSGRRDWKDQSKEAGINDQRFTSGPLLSEKGVHFCAGKALLNRNGKLMGSLLVLDTRTRYQSARGRIITHRGESGCGSARSPGGCAASLR